jgi:anti-sigma-K factor RskA
MRLADPRLRDRLAAEYVLGTLRGRARAAFGRRLREDGALETEVARWEARLLPMASAVRPVAPPRRLWRDIEARLGAAPRPESFWNQLRFWRALGLAASAACAVFVAIGALVLQRKAELPASYLAVLSDPKTARAVLVVTAARHEAVLHVKTLDPAIHVSNASLELWALPKGKRPQSLGLVPAAAAALRLAAAADQALADVPMLAVSLEPPGGSRSGAPSGPVLYSGPCVKYW